MAVRANENIDLGTISVSEVEFDDVVLFAESNEPVSEVQPFHPVGRTEHTLEVGTVNADKGCAEPGSVGTPLGYRKCRNAVALSPSPPNQFARFCGKGSDVIKTPEARKFSRSVGGQTHGRTNFSQLGGLFINIGGQPPLAQRKSKRQATNTAANNADTNLGPVIENACDFKLS